MIDAQTASQERMTEESAGRFDGLTRILHWVFAVGIIYASIVGYSLHFASEGSVKAFFSHLNMSLATVLIALFPARVIWRVRRPEPRPIEAIPPAQRRVARRVQTMIYFVIGWTLLSGYLMVPDHYRFFNLITIPTPFAKGPVTEFMSIQHRMACISLSGLVILHVAALMKHQLLSSIPVIRRMI